MTPDSRELRVSVPLVKRVLLQEERDVHLEEAGLRAVTYDT